MQDNADTTALVAQGDALGENETSLFKYCRVATDSFSGLGDVAENMRILSLNAELAAGRAGQYGVSIRALTQYTRELVNRLEQIHKEMSTILDDDSAEEEKVLIPGAETGAEGEEAASGDEEASETEEKAERVFSAEEQLEMIKRLKDLAGTDSAVKYLSEQAKRIAEVVSQSNSIATNMAIEAATSGQYEETFTNVANDMRGFVDKLKEMVTSAEDAIEKATRAEKAIKDAASVAA